MTDERDYRDRPITLIERMARAIADANGDDIDAIPLNKSEWIEKRGEFGGRFRECSEPYRTCYWEMAIKAVGAMREPTDRMVGEGDSHLPQFDKAEGDVDNIEVVKSVWEAMASEALREFAVHGPLN